MAASRRDFLMGLAAAGLGGRLSTMALASVSSYFNASASCPFRLAVINDELTQDFDRACQIASKDFGLQWNAATETGGVVLGDDVNLHASVEFTKGA